MVEDDSLQFLDAGFIALVKRPLLDALGFHEAGEKKNLEVLAGGGLADPQFFGNQHPANAVFDQIAVDLGPEVRAWLLQPFQDLQPAVVR